MTALYIEQWLHNKNIPQAISFTFSSELVIILAWEFDNHIAYITAEQFDTSWNYIESPFNT